MTKLKVGDRVKDVSDSAPQTPYAKVVEIDSLGHISVEWDSDVKVGIEYVTMFHPYTYFVLIERKETNLDQWKLMQVSIHNKEKFKETLLSVLNEGRKLTPMEVVKVEDFLGVV